MSDIKETVMKVRQMATEIKVVFPKPGEAFEKVCEVAIKLDELADLRLRTLEAKDALIAALKDAITSRDTLISALKARIAELEKKS